MRSTDTIIEGWVGGNARYIPIDIEGVRDIAPFIEGDGGIVFLSKDVI